MLASKYAKAQCAKATKSPSVADLAWAAGFIEGEGTFSPLQVTLRNGERRSYARIIAYQNNPEPLEKLQAMFGGVIRRFERKRATEKAGTWAVNGSRARGVMFTLYTFLSAKRREQVRMSLKGVN